MGKFSSSKVLKSTRFVQDVIWTGLVRCAFRHSSVLGTQMAGEEELGSCIPTVFQGNIETILLDAVRV
jgi:hypothetical protein